jgi:cellulase/cellobiase CelA1
MVDAGQKQTNAAHVFDLVERNIPGQDTNENIQPINGIEFFLWMIGITGALFLLRYAFHLLF